MTQPIQTNESKTRINYDLLAETLKQVGLLRNFEATGGDTVEYVEMTYDDNRSRSINWNEETNTWEVHTVIYDNETVDTFSTVEDAVTHITHNYIHDMGRGVVESFELESVEDGLIDNDTVTGLFGRVSKGNGAKDSAIKAVNYINGFKPKDNNNREKIVYEIGFGAYTNVKDKYMYFEIKNALEICIRLNIVESVQVDIYQEQTEFTVKV